MAASMPWIWIIVYSIMDGCTHTTYISCIWDISCTSLRRFSDGGVFSWTRSRKAFHHSLSLGPHALGGLCYTAICHCPCNSPSRKIGGLISWPMSSEITWKHFHGIPLNMHSHCPEDNSLWKTLKTPLFALAWVASSLLAPMGEILQRGRANWRSVPESHSRQPF